MKNKPISNIKTRLKINRMEPSILDYFDEREYIIELDTYEQDLDWDKKRKEDELRGYSEENWYEGDYDF